MEIFTIKKRKEFLRVAGKGQKVVTSSLVLQAAQNLCLEENKRFVGYTTTKKIGKAHIRNRARRRLRAAVRQVFPSLSQPQTSYVLIGRRNTADCTFTKLCKDLTYALKKIHSAPNTSAEKTNEQPLETIA